MQEQTQPTKKKVKNKNWNLNQETISVKKPQQTFHKQFLKQKRYKDITELQHKYSFNIQSIMGSGYASTVYLGQKVDTHQMVCVKAIDLVAMGYSGQYMELIHKEIQYLQGFDSEFIVKLYDVYESNTFYYLVMELCPGGDVYKMLKMFPMNLPNQFVSCIIEQVTRGLMQIQQKGLIHRDLKTENLFILKYPQAANEKIRIKIGDLGFCISVQDLQKLKAQGKVIQNVGSPIYMSPEVSKNQPFTFSSDIYSLGIIWYELYHKKAPWEALSQQQLLEKKLTRPVQIWRQDIPAQIKQIISKCISNQPETRPTCEQILKILQDLDKKVQDI